MELNRRTFDRMTKIVVRGSMGGVFVYLLVGIFGYATFSLDAYQQLLHPSRSGNILEADYYGSKAIQFVKNI